MSHSTVELENGITAIEIRCPEKPDLEALSKYGMKDFSLPDVTTYDQTWDDRVVARVKIKRERDRERAEGVAIRRQLQEIHRLHHHLLTPRHRNCHQDLGGVGRSQFSVQCLPEDNFLNAYGDHRAISAPACINKTSRHAGRSELISSYSQPEPTPRVRSTMSVLDSAIPPLSNGCMRLECVTERQEVEFSSHKRSLTGTFRFRHNLLQRKEQAVNPNYKSLLRHGSFEQRSQCSIPNKPQYYVLPPGRSSKRPSSPILSPLESKLLQARFKSTMSLQRNVKGNKKSNKLTEDMDKTVTTIVLLFP
jgi:hypothetical protein